MRPSSHPELPPRLPSDRLTGLRGLLRYYRNILRVTLREWLHFGRAHLLVGAATAVLAFGAALLLGEDDERVIRDVSNLVVFPLLALGAVWAAVLIWKLVTAPWILARRDARDQETHLADASKETAKLRQQLEAQPAGHRFIHVEEHADMGSSQIVGNIVGGGPQGLTAPLTRNVLKGYVNEGEQLASAEMPIAQDRLESTVKSWTFRVNRVVLHDGFGWEAEPWIRAVVETEDLEPAQQLTKRLDTLKTMIGYP